MQGRELVVVHTADTVEDALMGDCVAVITLFCARLYGRRRAKRTAGSARAFRTNRQNAYDAFLQDLTDYAEAKAKATVSGVRLDPKVKEPQWSEWNLPELRVPAIQANANVVVLEPSEDSTFDYW